jgi:hypothetical protein
VLLLEQGWMLRKCVFYYLKFFTCDPVDATGKAFEHVSGVLESVDGEEKSHDHQEETDDCKGNFSSAVI